MSTEGSPQPVTLFYSYSHKDEALRDELATHLTILKRLGILAEWHDRQITAGEQWADQINENLETAQIILLLISADFLASEYCYSKEMRRALERHTAGQACVIPVIVRPVDWQGAPFSMLQAVPKNAKAVSLWASRDEAWEDAAKSIRAAIEKFAKASAPLPATPPAAGPAPPAPIAQATAVSTQALRALRELMKTPAVRQAVENFRAGFCTASKQIEILVTYKDLHDLLHTLQFQCYNFAMQESRKATDADVGWDSLIDPETTLLRIIGEIEEVAQRPLLRPADTAWLAALKDAHMELKRAGENSSLKQLKQATNLLNRVLASQPLQINIRLNAAARNLPLEELVKAMSLVRQQLTGADLDSDEGRQFEAGVKSLEELGARLAILTDEHDRWQDVDSEMRRIETQLGADTEDLKFSWPGLKAKFEGLYAVSAEEWVPALKQEAEKLESALGADLPLKIRQSFRRCYSQAGTRFYEIDLRLKRLCDRLREVGAALTALLKDLP